MIALSAKERALILKIAALRQNPSEHEADNANLALERQARTRGVSAADLLAYVHAAETAVQREQAAAARRRARRSRSQAERDAAEFEDARFYPTSAAFDGPARVGVTAITIVTGGKSGKNYRWWRGQFVKFGGKSPGKFFLMRSVPIDDLDDLHQHVRTLTKHEHALQGEPIEDTPHEPKRRLMRDNRDGGKAAIRDAKRPYIMLDFDSLAPIPATDVRRMTTEQIHRYATVDLPVEFRRADCLVFRSSSFGTQPGLVKCHIWYWLDKAIGGDHRELWLKALNIEAGLTQEEGDRAVDPLVGRFYQAIFCAAPNIEGAPDPVSERWGKIAGETRTVPVPTRASLAAIVDGKRKRRQPREDMATGGASGTSGGWLGLLESMGGANHYYELTNMALGSYVRRYGADCDPTPFFEVFDRLMDTRFVDERDDQAEADRRKDDVRDLMAHAKWSEGQKGKPRSGARKAAAGATLTLAEARARLRNETKRIIAGGVVTAATARRRSPWRRAIKEAEEHHDGRQRGTHRTAAAGGG